MKELSKVQNAVFRIGAILMLIGAAIHLFHQEVSLWVYTIGALAFCLMQVKAEYMGRDFTIIRLRRQQLLACVLFILTSVCMSMQAYQYGIARRNEWVVTLTIACVIELYTSLRIPAALKK